MPLCTPFFVFVFSVLNNCRLTSLDYFTSYLTCFRGLKFVYLASEHRGPETFLSSPTKAVVIASSLESRPKRKATVQPSGNGFTYLSLISSLCGCAC